MNIELSSQERLSAWGEGCACHEPIFEHRQHGRLQMMSEYRRRKLIRSHFGEGRQVCPMAGKRADEMALGRLRTVLEDCWEHVRQEVMAGDVAILHPLAPEDLELLENDMLSATTAISTWAQSRCDFWIRLPWALAGLASPHEEQARALCVRLCRTFDLDPRPPPVHHVRTWTYMRSESPFRQDLNRFCAGVPRSALSAQTLEEIAKLKFMPIAETTIEAKHQRVSLAKKKHSIGPVKVSLANRLPMLERMLLAQPAVLHPLLGMFASARNLCKVAEKLDFQGHPLLEALPDHPKPWQLKPALERIIYHTDLQSAHRDLKRHSKADESKKEKRRRQECALVKAKGEVGEDTVWNKALHDYFSQIAVSGQFYSCPIAAGGQSIALSSFLGTIGTQAQPLAPAEGDDLHSCVELVESHRFFFKVGLVAPSSKRTIKVAPGAGQRIDIRNKHMFSRWPARRFWAGAGGWRLCVHGMGAHSRCRAWVDRVERFGVPFPRL